MGSASRALENAAGGGAGTAAGTGWQARLALGFVRAGDATRMRSRHSGPLTVQKALYPEGPTAAHGIILHPPGGVVGGDRLAIEVRVERGARALLTTPGAAKLYRSAGPAAALDLSLEVEEGACLEWLPQETLVFDGARASVFLGVSLAPGASWIGWEVIGWGRPAARAPFSAGELRLATCVDRAGRPLWRERAVMPGDSPLLRSPVGLAGATVSGTMLAVGSPLGAELLAACRAVAAREAVGYGVTRRGPLLVARFVGRSAEAGREYFVALWRLLRPSFIGREAVAPRIWST